VQDGVWVAGEAPFTGMDLRDFATTESNAFVTRLVDAAEEAIQEARAHAEEQIAAVRAQVDGLQSELEVEAARAAAVEADLDTVIEAHRQVEAERDKANATIAALRADVDAATALMDQATTEAQATLQTTRTQFAVELSGLQAEILALQTKQDTTASDARAFQEKFEAAQRENAEQASTIRQLQKRLTQTETAVSSTLNASVRAIDALDGATTSHELFETLVNQLAIDLPRVALFRVKGNHLVGEHGAGVDPGVDMTKLMIPMSVDSVITRAVALGGLVRADGEQLADTRAPFGGTPACALAVPIIFQDEILAVLYADLPVPATQAHATSMVLLARHSSVLLSRLMQELKSLKELRDYAGSLLKEAEQMFAADAAATRTEEECISRLRETIECGRHIYAQRAALEAPAAAGLIDEQIRVIIDEGASPFADALSAATKAQEVRRTAS
jgi:hypothetical protein